jgi:hypothetical protein
MKKSLAAAMAAITFGGALAAAAAPAQARPYDHGYGGYDYGRHYDNHRGSDAAGAAIVAGIAGLAIGAALSNGNGHSYAYNNDGYYPRRDYGYYDYGYARPAYQVCESRRWVWDPYIGRNVPVRERYAC